MPPRPLHGDGARGQLQADWPRFSRYLSLVAPGLLDPATVQATAEALALEQHPGARDLAVGSAWDGPTAEDEAEFCRVHYQ